MQTIKSIVDYTYGTLNAMIACLLLFLSTIFMPKASSDFTKQDADDIINHRNVRRGPDNGGSGDQGSSSTIKFIVETHRMYMRSARGRGI
jgi:hypothetical protein